MASLDVLARARSTCFTTCDRCTTALVVAGVLPLFDSRVAFSSAFPLCAHVIESASRLPSNSKPSQLTPGRCLTSSAPDALCLAEGSKRTATSTNSTILTRVLHPVHYALILLVHSQDDAFNLSFFCLCSCDRHQPVLSPDSTCTISNTPHPSIESTSIVPTRDNAGTARTGGGETNGRKKTR